MSPLAEAAACGDDPEVRQLLENGALHDDVPMMALLIERGARTDIRDTLWNATPLGWATYTAKPEAEAYLRSL